MEVEEDEDEDDEEQEHRQQQLQPLLTSPSIKLAFKSQETPLLNGKASAESFEETEALRFAERTASASRPAIATSSDISVSANGSASLSSLSREQVDSILQSCLPLAESQAAKLLHQTVDTVQSKILRAIHQAALDLIERLGKDAAIRAILAEQKAAVLERELVNVKQQALSMLLRLKGNTDAQISEAEKKYMSERKRAQDAEAKLLAMQDTSKRLKSELKRKGEILEKMQKLVQPIYEDHLDKSSGLVESTDRRRISAKSKFKDLHSNIQQLEAENTMLFSTESTNNFRCIKDGSPLVSSDVVSLSAQHIESRAHQPHASAPEYMETERRLESSTTGISSITEIGCIGGRLKTVPPYGKHEDTSFLQHPLEEGSVVEKTYGEYFLLQHREGASTDQSNLDKESAHANSSSLLMVGKTGQQVDKLQDAGQHEHTLSPVAADLQRASDLCGAKTDKIEACEKLACCDSLGRDPESSACMSEGESLVFARPDYEIATSIAELAQIGSEAGKTSGEASASNAREQEVENRPHRLGQRMRHKGTFFEQKDGLGLEIKQTKRPRIAKKQAGSSDSHLERMLKKPRLVNSSSKHDLAVDSSRDSRRLMQGARQLLCLSEKKWE